MRESASPKERLLRVLKRQPVDRAPVACPGGMMNAAVVAVMEQTGSALPEAYADPAKLAALARDVARLTGFENLALPFCMTLEAELLGSRVDPGTIAVEARIAEEAFPSVRDAAVSLPRLKASYPDLITMGNVSTQTLQFGEPERIASRARQLVDEGVDIIAPACGLSTSTPLVNIRALTDTVREA